MVSSTLSSKDFVWRVFRGTMAVVVASYMSFSISLVQAEEVGVLPIMSQPAPTVTAEQVEMEMEMAEESGAVATHTATEFLGGGSTLSPSTKADAAEAKPSESGVPTMDELEPTVEEKEALMRSLQ